MTKIYLGDRGTLFTVDVGCDITAATALSLEVRKPDGTKVSWTGSISGTNAIQYTIQNGNLDQAGTWRLQAKVTIGTDVWLGETTSFEVFQAFR